MLTPEAIEIIRRYSPLLEVGAGTGYWASELARAGADIIATDPGHSAGFFRRSPRYGQEILKLEARDAIRLHPERNLLMCWPHTGGWTWEAARDFRGQRLIYVGEGRMGCTGGSFLFDILRERYEIEGELEIPTFRTIHDRLQVWKVKTMNQEE